MKINFPGSVTAASATFVALTLIFGSGCASSFANSSGYDEQGCVERALRRSTDVETLTHASTQFADDCNHGDSAACSALGVMSEIGAGMPKDDARAVRLYERACKAGNKRGCTNLGIARAEGIAGKPDALAAAHLLEPSCDAADAHACAYLARMHVTGKGVAKDEVQASHLFEIACNGGEGAACLTLGDMLARDREPVAAMDSYGKGCLHGDATSCARLSEPKSVSEGAVALVTR